MPREFFFERENFDAEQLRWDLEDFAGVQIGENYPGDITQGDIRTSGGTKICIGIYEDGDAIALRAPGNATAPKPQDFGTLIPRIVREHQKRPPRHRGEMSGVVTRFSRSVARIVVVDKDNGDEKSGSGFIYKNNGFVLTAAHVVDPDRYAVKAIYVGGSEVQCEAIEKLDTKRDLALLRLSQTVNVPVIKVRHPLSFPSDLGMQCVVIGYPSIPLMLPSESVYLFHRKRVT